ncbi:hypothetical protein X736_15725 [Mesorhizobium sp. L2C089B000]|nr:hypothetical protein X736_15725 [Mesorhizobium sp. L2C089B000]
MTGSGVVWAIAPPIASSTKTNVHANVFMPSLAWQSIT